MASSLRLLLVASMLLRSAPRPLRRGTFRLYAAPPRRSTGAFQQLPQVHPVSEIFNRARKRALKAKPAAPDTAKNPKVRAAKQGAVRLQELSAGMSVPLKEVLDTFERLDAGRGLHPFEQRLSELTIRAFEKRDGAPRLRELLEEVKEVRKACVECGKRWAAEVKNAPTARQADESQKLGFEDMALLADEARASMDFLVDLVKDLRRVPVVQLTVPSVVLVGAPNVGKSSIVRGISSGTPEVNNYPFTTRGVTIGHVHNSEVFQLFGKECQVMDTPGMLERSDEERNEMEELTVASLLYLPTAVIFVMDPSGMSGTDFAAQRRIRDTLRKRFPQRPWLDVVSKSDAERGADYDAAHEPEGALQLSAELGTNMEELADRVQHMLEEVSQVLQARVAQAQATTEDARVGEA